MQSSEGMEAWQVLSRFLPEGWQEQAKSCEAMQRARGEIRSPELLLRLILMHAAGGLSLEQTVMRAREQGLATLSAVALFKRLRRSGRWLEWMTQQMVHARSQDWSGENWGHRPIRIIDATDIQEPGPSGTDWRLHYCLRLPQLSCDFLRVTAATTGETLKHLPVRRGEIIVADRGYSNRAGVAQILAQGADVVVRLNSAALPLEDEKKRPLDLLALVGELELEHALDIPGWFTYDGQRRALRLCALRKSETAAAKARKKATRDAMRKGHEVQPTTLDLAGFVLVLTSLPIQWGSAWKVLDLYRHRWQVELAFKRLKSLLALGHVPKTTDPSAQAWMQAKVLTALLIERILTETRSFSPWGYRLLPGTPMAALPGSAR
jgi:hypothetical protein